MGSVISPNGFSPSQKLNLTPKKRIAVIGAGPAGAIAIDALVQEQSFDVIRVFERREAAGGCWLDDTAGPLTPKPHASASTPVPGLKPEHLPSLASRTADQPIPIPSSAAFNNNSNNNDNNQELLRQESRKLRELRCASAQPRFLESSIYPYLETNVDVLTMQYSQEPIVASPTERSVRNHGAETPFRHWTAMRDYIQQDLVAGKGYERFIEYNTTVERAEKIGDEWRLVLRKEVVRGTGNGGASEKEGEEGQVEDQWSVEFFDGLVVASGHFSVPYIPAVEGLVELARSRPDRGVLHSKHFRGRDGFTGKRVMVVGASVSAADIAFDLVGSASHPVHAVMVGRNANPFFGDGAFQHPGIARHPTILKIEVDGTAGGNTVHFIDGTSVTNIDHIIFGTGYSWTAPFLQTTTSSSQEDTLINTKTSTPIRIRNNRITNLYQHVISTTDPSLTFIGGVGAGLTFKIFEWQAVLAASTLSGRANLPPISEMEKWEEDRIREKGDGKGFLTIYPAFREYFDGVRALACAAVEETREGEKAEEEGSGGHEHGANAKSSKGKGRQLPAFDPKWEEAFMAGHELRKNMWRRRIEEDVAKMENTP